MLFEHIWAHHDVDATALAAAKREQGLSVSVCLPARNEEATVGEIVERIDATLVEPVDLVDEIVVMDDGSTDATATVAAAAGATVHAVADVLPEAGPGSGKGDVLWKSLHVTSGDLICWVDADLLDFEPHVVTGLLGPLLTHPHLGFVKGFYERPVDGEGRGGGRVTELMARPLLSRFFPHLAPVIQPLGGEYAGRRSLLEAVPFVEGWGVELGLLVDVVERFGAGRVGQVDLGVRRHRHRSLDELAPQALAILITALRRAGVDTDADPDAESAQLLRALPDERVERVDVEVRERPPITGVPAYQAGRGLRPAREQTA